MMKPNNLHHVIPALLVAGVLFFSACDHKTDNIIITDDVIMLTLPAANLEKFACADFAANRSVEIPEGDSVTVNWSEGLALANDSVKILRYEVLRDTGALLKFTMTLRPLSGRPSEIQCMKGFGCESGAWENFPWKSPAGNFLDHTTHQFRVIPRGVSKLTFENYNLNEKLILRINPDI